MKQPAWRTLNIPGGKTPVAYTYQGARHPVVCLRSLLAALGLAWATWRMLCMQVCDLRGWPLPPAQDAQGRPTHLLGARLAPRFLAALAPRVASTWPTGGNRLAMAAERLSVGHFENALPIAVTAPATPAQASAQAEAISAPSGPISPPPKKGTITITREVERQALALAAQGQGSAAIGRHLGISRAAASLLVRGKYRFAATQAQRPPLAHAAPMRHARTGRPAKITADTGRQVLALHAQGYAQAEVARRLGISKATVNLLVHGKYQFAESAHA